MSSAPARRGVAGGGGPRPVGGGSAGGAPGLPRRCLGPARGVRACGAVRCSWCRPFSFTRSLAHSLTHTQTLSPRTRSLGASVQLVPAFLSLFSLSLFFLLLCFFGSHPAAPRGPPVSKVRDGSWQARTGTPWDAETRTTVLLRAGQTPYKPPCSLFLTHYFFFSSSGNRELLVPRSRRGWMGSASASASGRPRPGLSCRSAAGGLCVCSAWRGPRSARPASACLQAAEGRAGGGEAGARSQ